ncbi:MAG: hypothetical protein LKJ69_09175 [Lactobacillus sp.]|jgi:hypothetical protein|nr:hypothetical protein [Lactobacillus sp.]MCI2033538.1 hypothetical protein [Lactobacillus sp.]
MVTITTTQTLPVHYADREQYDLFDCAFLFAYRIADAFPYHSALYHYRDGWVYFRAQLRAIRDAFATRWQLYHFMTEAEQDQLFRRSALPHFHYTTRPTAPFSPVRCLWTPNRYDQISLYMMSPLCGAFQFADNGLTFTTSLQQATRAWTVSDVHLSPAKCAALADYCAQLPELAYNKVLPQIVQTCYDLGFPLPPVLAHRQIYSLPWLPLARQLVQAYPKQAAQLLSGRRAPSDDLGALAFLLDWLQKQGETFTKR